MWISYACKVQGPRSIVQFFEHRVGTRVGVCLGDIAFEIVQVTKLDGLGWTGILTSGSDFVGTNLAMLDLGLNFSGLNALNAVGAFLHYTTTANGDFRVHHQVLQFSVTFGNLVGTGVLKESFCIAVVEEVKSTHLIRTVVTAVSSTDAAVINHVVKPFVAVHRCGDRADGFAWSILTVVTSDWLVHNLNFIRHRFSFVVISKSIGVFDVEIVAIVAINSHPMHFSATPNIVFTNDWNVVLSLTSDDT